MKQIVLAVLAFVMAFGQTAYGQDSSLPVLKIGVREYAGCVEVLGNNRYSGYEWELFNAVWREAGYPGIEVTVYESLGETLAAVENGEVDVAFSGTTITAKREAKLDAITSLEDAGYSMAVAGGYTGGSWKDTVAFYTGEGSVHYFKYLGLVVLLGAVLYFLDWRMLSRRQREQELEEGTSHITNFVQACVLAMNKITTIGTGDITMRRKVTQVAAILILVPMGLAFFGEFFSDLTSYKTERRIEASITDVSDLAGKQVATKAGTASIDVIKDYNGIPKPVRIENGGLEKCIMMVREREVSAALHDHTELVSLVAEMGVDDIVVVGPIRQQQYGFFLRERSPFEEPLRQATIRLQQEGLQDKLKTKYFGGGDS